MGYSLAGSDLLLRTELFRDVKISRSRVLKNKTCNDQQNDKNGKNKYKTLETK